MIPSLPTCQHTRQGKSYQIDDHDDHRGMRVFAKKGKKRGQDPQEQGSCPFFATTGCRKRQLPIVKLQLAIGNDCCPVEGPLFPGSLPEKG
jgi:hypothetical protein